MVARRATTLWHFGQVCRAPCGAPRRRNPEKNRTRQNRIRQSVLRPTQRRLEQLYRRPRGHAVRHERARRGARSLASCSSTSYDALHAAAAALSTRILRAVPLVENSEAVVACLVRRGFSLILCQLAVLHSQHAFLLVDPTLPIARREYLLDDSGAVLLLTLTDDETYSIPTASF